MYVAHDVDDRACERPLSGAGQRFQIRALGLVGRGEGEHLFIGREVLRAAPVEIHVGPPVAMRGQPFVAPLPLTVQTVASGRNTPNTWP